jgi:hypothetical protein
MLAILEAADSGRAVEIEDDFRQPLPLSEEESLALRREEPSPDQAGKTGS